MNRRAFAKLSAAALGLPALAAARRLPLPQSPAPAAAAAPEAGAMASALLTPDEMARYRQSLPDRQRTIAHLGAVAIPYSVEPDFIFRAAVPKLPALRRPRRGGR